MNQPAPQPVDPTALAGGLIVETSYKTPENELDQKHRHKMDGRNWWFDRALLLGMSVVAVSCIFYGSDETVKRGGFTLLGVIGGTFAGALRATKN